MATWRQPIKPSPGLAEALVGLNLLRRGILRPGAGENSPSQSNGPTRPRSGDPQSFAIDSAGFVYLVDPANDRVQKFTPEGDLVSSWDSRGTGDGQFDNPVAVTTDAERYVYVTDLGNHRIQKFTPDGTFVAKWDM